MPLTYAERVELLAKARQAKKEKMLASKAPVSAPVNNDSESSGEDMEEVNNAPPKVHKVKAPNPKWLRVPEKPKKVDMSEKVSKEEYVIDDEPVKVKAVRAKKAVAKPPSPEPEPEPEPQPKKRATRKAKEPVKTLDIVAEPKAIEEVMSEVVNNDEKYKPKPRAKPVAKSNPITITKSDTPFSLFDY